jgi:hypothetical protein
MEGVTGYGMVWQQCAYLVESFCLRILIIKLDLKLAEAMAGELHYTGSFPDEKKSQELGIDAEVVKSMMWGLQGRTLKDEIPFYWGSTKELDEGWAE